MTDICEKCAIYINGDSIKCGGFCSSMVCMRCSGIAEETYASVRANVHLVWMCTACINLMSKARFANSLVSVNKAGESVIESIKTEIRDGVLTDIRNEIRSNFKALINSVPPTPVPPYRTPHAPSTRAKRLRENDDDDDIAIRRPAKALCGIGTSAAITDLVAPEAAEQDSGKFWLYLSGILPEVPDSKVCELVESKLKISNPQVVKLVPRGKDIRTLTFISYKIGIPFELKSIALASETWPRGIRFREFENTGNKKQFFWRPEDAPPNPIILTETPKAASILQ